MCICPLRFDVRARAIGFIICSDIPSRESDMIKIMESSVIHNL